MHLTSTSGTSTAFQFITSINTVARDDETRRKVRSHARRQKLPKEISTPQVKKSISQKERTSKFRLKPAASSESSKKSHVISKDQGHGVAIALEDKPKWKTSMITNELALTVARELPNFSLLRIETTPMTENLLKYCMTVCLSPREKFVEKWFNRAGAPTYMNTYYSGFLANAFAMNPSGTWFDSIQVDAAATHAFLAMVAAMHNSLAMWGDTSTIDFHRFQAVKSINERLNLEGKDDDKPVSDGVIVAVALLVNIEAHIGSLTAAAAHMNGLKRMVDLRGGIIEGFQHSTLLQRAIAWADFSYATAAHKPVVFPFIPQLASSLSLHDRFTSRSMMANMEPLEFRDLTIQNREAIELFELLYSITECINDFDYTNLESMSAERVQASDSIYLVEWRLCQLEELSRTRHSLKRAESLPLVPSVEDNNHAKCPSTTDLSDALVYAAHLFLHLAIRGQPPAAHRHRALIEALMSSLCDAILTLDLLSDPETYGSPMSQGSGGSSGISSTESWITYTSSDASHSSIPTPREPRNELHANILLWALFVGSCVRVPISSNESSFAHHMITLGEHHEFLINALKRYCRLRNILDKETLLAKLKDIMWLDRWCENQLELVWLQIEDYLRPWSLTRPNECDE
ncbi:hypothetical protein F4779DRAFT_626546 [Xylariaceae sp. FL0662B]|nr:hypothetical protein F4779DRAFT_626546 [Xylariaceae sp. FL0662B]